MKNKYITFFVSCALILGLYSCSSDDTTDKQEDNNKKEQSPAASMKYFRGYIDSTAMRANRLTSRTMGVYGDLGSGRTGIRFYWDETEDGNNPYLFFYDGSTWRNLYTRDVLERDVNNRITSATWTINSVSNLDQESYKIRYGNYVTSNREHIYGSQTQLIPGQATSLRQYGDCATATAENNGLWYEFTLKHQASYITFMPYAGTGDSQETLKKCKLWRVRISADEIMSNTYFTFTDDGFDQTAPWPTSGQKYIQLECANNTTQNYTIPDSKANAKNNGAIMVLAPGTYTNVRVEYTVYDPVVRSSAIFVKTIPTLTLRPGRNTPMYSSLTCKDYSSRFGLYHMWGARDYYWNSVFPASHNWGQYGIPAQTNYPTSGQLRYYSNVDAFLSAEVDAPTGTLDRDAPTVNKLLWYVQRGDPRWDPEPFTYDGHLFTGRMWFLKASVIAPLYGVSEASMSSAAPNGNNRATGNVNESGTVRNWSDVGEAQRSNYFYVVPLGYYNSIGQLKMLENDSYGYSYFWSSTGSLYGNFVNYNNTQCAHCLQIQVYNPYTSNSSARAYVYGYYNNSPNLRNNGYQPWPGEVYTYN